MVCDCDFIIILYNYITAALVFRKFYNTVVPYEFVCYQFLLDKGLLTHVDDNILLAINVCYRNAGKTDHQHIGRAYTEVYLI